MYTDLSEVGFAFTSDRQSFAYGSRDDWRIKWGPYRSRGDVHVAIDDMGRLFIGPATSGSLGWMIDRKPFLASVSMFREFGLNALRGDALLVCFPKSTPGENFAIGRQAFEHGVKLALAAIADFDARAAAQVVAHPNSD